MYKISKVVTEKSLTKTSMIITLERELEKGGKIEKEGKNNSNHLGFVYSNTLDCLQHEYQI